MKAVAEELTLGCLNEFGDRTGSAKFHDQPKLIFFSTQALLDEGTVVSCNVTVMGKLLKTNHCIYVAELNSIRCLVIMQ